MEINRTNYEAYFIDYLEGNLDEQLVDGFIEFIKQNPDLKEELELFEPVALTAEPVEFNKKESLIKEKFDSEQEFDKAAIATLEGDISLKEQQAFEAYLSKYPEKKKEANLFQHSVLRADNSIIYPHKNKLYKKPFGKVILLWSGRVAAVFILALAIFSLLNKSNNPEEINEQLAQVKEAQPLPQQNENVHKANEPGAQLVTTSVDETMEPSTPKEKVRGKIIIQDTPIETGKKQELIASREPLIVPAIINGRDASIEAPVVNAGLATMTLHYPDEFYDDEWLLASKVKSKFSLQKISKAGLNLIANISDDRFTYETNEEGKVSNYKYDSRLLAFSIPGKQTNPE